jgi:hypothetical protein
MNENEVLAIIKNAGFGMRDNERPCLFFDVMFDDSSGALQVFFNYDDICRIIKDHDVWDVTNLNGKACWIEINGGIARWLRAFKGNR